jgi:sorbitol/mannitol transport system substrate-binding protein
MKLRMISVAGAAILALASTGLQAQTKLTIAMVNNGDMIRMQKLSDDFTAKHPEIHLEWVTPKRILGSEDGT